MINPKTETHQMFVRNISIPELTPLQEHYVRSLYDPDNELFQSYPKKYDRIDKIEAGESSDEVWIYASDFIMLRPRNRRALQVMYTIRCWSEYGKAIEDHDPYQEIEYTNYREVDLPDTGFYRLCENDPAGRTVYNSHDALDWTK